MRIAGASQRKALSVMAAKDGLPKFNESNDGETPTARVQSFLIQLNCCARANGANMLGILGGLGARITLVYVKRLEDTASQDQDFLLREMVRVKTPSSLCSSS
ncbi:hypothetical protein GJ744_005111 [Endocarpon pusillum]|uniref:Uncharacterized protein n=1 Tax=Endocarpon pusillum TaxID=364733 RepID=A0A8H7AN56_9EURO|nr:hypothetical protein GJ744_005111 [Endocarpon pusillum]